MKVFKETTIEEFKAWSGASHTKSIIVENDKCCEFNQMIEELYPDGLSETELNDMLWFEDEWIFESIGININYKLNK